VISFLQHHPKVSAGHIQAEENLGVMLLELLELYGTRFNFERVGIAIDSKGSYFDKLSYQATSPMNWRKICIRDPNNATNNIAKASHQADAIIKIFADAFRELSNRCYVVHGKISRDQTCPWGTARGSILDAIIHAPDVSVRRRIARKWTSDMNSRPVLRLRAAIPQPDSKNKRNRAERRAAIKRVSGDKSSSPRSKGSTTHTEGDREMPIVLDDSLPPLPEAKPVESAAERLRTTGSIRGISRTIIEID
jgi:DNA polymerase sigma